MICVDGSQGLLAALPTAYHGIPVQRCRAHKMCPRQGSQQDAVRQDLHAVMNAVNHTEARSAARRFAKRWEDAYPRAVACLRDDLDDLLTCFRYKDPDQRRQVRTTNAIERRTSRNRLYTFWVGIREEAGLPGLRIHDCRHTRASQGVMNGVGLTTVGRLLGHRQRETTAIYATSTMVRCATPPPKRRPSSHAPWDTGPSRRPCRKKRTWRETAWNLIG